MSIRTVARALVIAVLFSVGVSTWQDASTGAASRYPRAMWLWDPDPQLMDLTRRQQFLDFCARENIGVVWMQVSTQPVEPASQPASGARVLNQAAEWRSLIADAHARHIKIEALDGDPKYALKFFHHTPLAVVDAIIEFNAQVKKDERFDGIHFDNEPYLLKGWRDPVAREAILRDFLELNVEIQRRVRKRSDMEYGIDIPFWWQYTDARTGRPHGDVAFNGKRQAASYHVIELLDNIGVMNYRNFASGNDGLVAHGRDLLVFADKARHARVRMGVETSRSTPVDVWFVLGLAGRPDLDALGEGSDEVGNGRFRGYRLRTFDDGTHTHVGLELPDGEKSAEQETVRSAAAELARRVGASETAQVRDQIEQVRGRAFRAFREDGEWMDLRPRPIPVAGTAEPYAGFIATHGMLPKLTFDGKTLGDMNRELEQAEAAFGRFKRYAGVAIHHYETYRALASAQ